MVAAFVLATLALVAVVASDAFAADAASPLALFFSNVDGQDGGRLERWMQLVASTVERMKWPEASSPLTAPV